MHIRTLALLAAIGLSAPATARIAQAEDNVIVFGEGVARFQVVHDRTAATMTFRLSDPAVRIAEAPVVVLQTDAGPREVALVAVEGQPGTWRLTDDTLRLERFDGTMKILVEGKPYSAPLAIAVTSAPAEVKVVAKHGGSVIAFPGCPAHVEVVRDLTAGTLTIYSFRDVQILEPPTITITESEGPATVKVTEVEGQPGTWKVTHTAFRTTTASGRIKIVVDGKPCEAPLTFVGARGGHIVAVSGGPQFEVVRDEKARAYTFYAVDETLDGKPYVIERPQVVVATPEGPRTVVLTPVEGEPRAWRLIGLEGGVSAPLDGRLQFTLFGKSLETRLGLSGFGLELK